MLHAEPKGDIQDVVIWPREVSVDEGNWRILLGYFGDLNCLGKLHGSILYKVPVRIIMCSYTPETHGRNPSQKGILIVFQPQFFQVLQ